MSLEDGRARGTVKMTKPGEFFDKSYTFAVSSTSKSLGAAKSAVPKSDVPAGGLVADSHNGLPFPEGGEGFQSEGSQFRKQTSKTITADLEVRRRLLSTRTGLPKLDRKQVSGQARKDVGNVIVHRPVRRVGGATEVPDR